MGKNISIALKTMDEALYTEDCATLICVLTSLTVSLRESNDHIIKDSTHIILNR